MTNHAHIFLRRSSSGISLYMRRLLSGYAISYNRRPPQAWASISKSL
jgi:hypothetical protein